MNSTKRLLNPKLMISGGLCLLMANCTPCPVLAQAIKPDRVSFKTAIIAPCLVGEAESEGFKGMTAVAEAIRNRGHLKGVYGCKSQRARRANGKLLHLAERAWAASATSDLVKGASYWESTDFKTPSWSKGMIETAHIGKHKFYKEKRI